MGCNWYLICLHGNLGIKEWVDPKDWMKGLGGLIMKFLGGNQACVSVEFWRDKSSVVNCYWLEPRGRGRGVFKEGSWKFLDDLWGYFGHGFFV